MLPTLSDSGSGRWSAFSFGLPTLDRFPQFSAIARKQPSFDIQVMPKTADIDQTWPFLLLPSSAYPPSANARAAKQALCGVPRSCTIRNHQHNTLGPSISRYKRNTETRDLGSCVYSPARFTILSQVKCRGARPIGNSWYGVSQT